MPSNKTIFRNTLFLYFRMLVVMASSLYTVRIVLNALGVEDYGIYGVAAGLVAILAFLNGTMSQAAQRFLSVDIGRNDPVALGRTFNATLMSHLAIAVLVVALSETLGLWLLNSKLNIPAERMATANFVYQCSIFTSALMIIQTPFNALIIAREKMWFFSAVSLLEALVKLLIAWSLLHADHDRLVLYALLMLASYGLTLVIYATFCLVKFKESSIRPHADTEIYKGLASFISWSFIGNLANVCRNQGSNLLLNVFFGPAMNASHAVMTQAQTATATFSNSFQMALNPQIYQSYAKSDRKRMHDLLFLGSRINFLLLIFLVAPAIHGADYIVSLWLEAPPPLAVAFIRLMLVIVLIDSISQPLITGAIATGRIKLYQTVIGGTIVLALPLSYAAFRFSENPKAFLYIGIGISVTTLLMRLAFLRQMVGLRITRFASSVILRLLGVSSIAYLTVVMCDAYFGPVSSIADLALVSFIMTTTLAIATATLGTSRNERHFIIQTVRRRISK